VRSGSVLAQIIVKRLFQDDLPTVRIPPLRALGVIAPETTEYVVRLSEVEQTVGVTLQRFANGGSWSLFRCPSCGRKARTLRLLCGQVLCTRCCVSRGVRPRADPMGVRQRAEHRIPKLRAMLDSPVPLRLRPHLLWSKIERRKRLEAALRKAELLVGYTDFVKRDKDESDGSAGEGS
jgi:hypothetical protein